MDAPDDEPPAIPAACLHVVLAQLPAAALASLSAVSRDFRDALQDDAVWRHRCALDYGVTTMAGPDMQPAPSFRATCAAWHPLFKRYGPLAARAAAAWRRVEGWTAAHVPAVAASLRPGATEAELDEAEAQLGFALPEALRALYAVHDGQRLEFDDGMDADRPAVGPSLFHGLFGGYCVYTHVVSTRMLPLRRMVMWTRRVADRLVQQAEEEEEEEDDEDADDGDPGGPPTRALFAASFNFKKLLYCTQLADVDICYSDQRRAARAAPPSAPGAADGVLRWFEAYAEALAGGTFGAELVHAERADSLGITLYPKRPPGEGEAVTRGVRIRAAPLFVPELSRPQAQLFFAYNVRMALLPQAAQAAAGERRPLRSVQLDARHWVIRGAEGETLDEVRGPGVVGHFPILEAGGPEFSYQSCTHQLQPLTRMDGTFSFVEGSLEAPLGRKVAAAVPRMIHSVPEIIF